MKVVYFNDEDKALTVRILDSRYDTATGSGDVYLSIEPQSFKELDLDIPEGSIPFIKRWPSMLLLSWIFPTDPSQ